MVSKCFFRNIIFSKTERYMAEKVSKETFALEDFGFCGWKLCTCSIPPSKGVKAWVIFALHAREK